MQQTIRLYVVRDLADGSILDATTDRSMAEVSCYASVGSWAELPGGGRRYTIPRLEIYDAVLGPMVGAVGPQRCRKLNDQRDARDDRRQARRVAKMKARKLLRQREAAAAEGGAR
jgi:hypothetical protein